MCRIIIVMKMRVRLTVRCSGNDERCDSQMKKLLCLILALVLSLGCVGALADNTLDFTYAEEVYAFSEDGMALFRARNGLYGFVNTRGEVALPAAYEDAYGFNDGLAAVRRGTLWGFINTSGELVIDYQWASVNSFSEGLAVVKDANGLYGYIDQTGTLVIPCQYKSAYSCKNGVMNVTDAGWRDIYINKAGEQIEDFVSEAEKLFTINESTSYSFHTFELVCNGRVIATTSMYDTYTDGFTYNRIRKVEGADSLWVITRTYKPASESYTTYILYDAAADRILMQNMSSISTVLSSGLIAVSTEGGAYYVDAQGVMATGRLYAEAYDFVDGYARVVDGDGFYTFITPDGKSVKSFPYASDMVNGFGVAEGIFGWYVIDSEFNRVK